MAHLFHEHRAHKVEHSRVAHITKGYASGGAVAEAPVAKAKRASGGKVMGERDAMAVMGKPAKERMDKPSRKAGGKVEESVNRARGGRTKHKGHTTVNVINTGGGHPGLGMGGPPPGLGAAPPMMPPRPPMAPPMPPGAPGMAPPGGAPMMPPPGMPPRRSGGRAYAKGGAVKDGPAWNEGKRAGTSVQNNPSGKNDQRDVGRGKPITYKTGGRIEAPQGVSAPHLPGGSGGGEARLAKERMAKRSVSGMVP